MPGMRRAIFDSGRSPLRRVCMLCGGCLVSSSAATSVYECDACGAYTWSWPEVRSGDVEAVLHARVHEAVACPEEGPEGGW
jgi:hypothetical protein